MVLRGARCRCRGGPGWPAAGMALAMALVGCSPIESYRSVVGVSRKGFIGTINGEPQPDQRVMGTAATVAWSIANGADIVRVHDVEAMVKVVRVIRAIQMGA